MMKSIYENKLSLSVIKRSIILIGLMMFQPSYAADFPAPGDFQQGAKTWADNCGRCHNYRGPNELRDDQWITTMFHMRVRGGLTGQETRDVLTFLQTSNSTYKPDTSVIVPLAGSPPLSGDVIYQQSCVACHGADGEGGMPGVPDLTDKSGSMSKSDAILIKHITEGFQSPGAPMAMPAMGGNPNLGEADIRAVLAYMRKTF